MKLILIKHAEPIRKQINTYWSLHTDFNSPFLLSTKTLLLTLSKLILISIFDMKLFLTILQKKIIA